MPAEETARVPGEKEIVWYEMTDEEIVASAKNGSNETENTQEEAVDSEPPTFSSKQKPEGISVVLSLLNIAEPTDLLVYKHLRTMQLALRMHGEKQMTLDHWFRSNSANSYQYIPNDFVRFPSIKLYF
jgi:hypothetical protein